MGSVLFLDTLPPLVIDPFLISVALLNITQEIKTKSGLNSNYKLVVSL